MYIYLLVTEFGIILRAAEEVLMPLHYCLSTQQYLNELVLYGLKDVKNTS